jgi:hypothetical protein
MEVLVLSFVSGTEYRIERYSESTGSLSTVLEFLETGDSLADIHVVDSLTYYAVGEDFQGAIAVWKTTDGGDTWNKSQIGGAGPQLFGIIFDADGTEGYIFGQGGFIFHTSDSGGTWTRVDGGNNFSYSYFGAHVLAPDVAIFAGISQDEVIEPILALTEDGGQTVSLIDYSGTGITESLGFIDGIGNEVWITVQDNEKLLHYGYDNAPNIPEATFRFNVTGSQSVDLTPVTNDLADIKGSGFSTSTDSLEEVRSKLDTAESNIKGDISAVQSDVSDVQGDTFAKSTDALDAVRSKLDTTESNLSSDMTDIKGSGFSSGTHSLKKQADDLSDVRTKTEKILGLSDENLKISNYSYDNNNNVTQADIDIYQSKSDLENDVNPINSYTMNATYDNDGNLAEYSIKETS